MISYRRNNLFSIAFLFVFTSVLINGRKVCTSCRDADLSPVDNSASGTISGQHAMKSRQRRDADVMPDLYDDLQWNDVIEPGDPDDALKISFDDLKKRIWKVESADFPSWKMQGVKNRYGKRKESSFWNGPKRWKNRANSRLRMNNRIPEVTFSLEKKMADPETEAIPERHRKEKAMRPQFNPTGW